MGNCPMRLRNEAQARVFHIPPSPSPSCLGVAIGAPNAHGASFSIDWNRRRSERFLCKSGATGEKNDRRLVDRARFSTTALGVKLGNLPYRCPLLFVARLRAFLCKLLCKPHTPLRAQKRTSCTERRCALVATAVFHPGNMDREPPNRANRAGKTATLNPAL